MKSYDDIVIGAGHNGLTAAAYLARAGRSVLVLEAADHVGGAAVSAMAFPGLPARLSRYSYLVSLMPRQIITDLELDVTLISRRYSSYTPLPTNPARGLLVDTADADATAAAFARITNGTNEFGAWQWFYERMGEIARAVFPTLIEPLRSAENMHDLVVDGDSSRAEIWELLTRSPLGELIERYFDDDVVRGIVATDGLIGTFADLHDPSLRQNICFLYHLIGGGTGDWDVPLGGMGAVSGALYQAAVAAGAEIRTDARVVAVDPADGLVDYVTGGHATIGTGGHAANGTGGHATIGTGGRVRVGTARGRMIHAGCAPAVLNTMLDEPVDTEAAPAGAQLKINLLLDRLPALRDASVSPAAAFSGTFHVNESYEQLRTAWRQARNDEVPTTPPCEIYCHTLADPSILGPELAGKHTLTVFGLHMPPTLFASPGAADHAVQATLRSLDSVLAEPIGRVVATDVHGNPCLEAKTPLDLDETIGLPGGNIFHRSLQWPWAPDAADVGTWGVQTRHPRLLVCGAGARRGGGVSGIPGRNAAAAVLGELVSW